MNVDFILNDLRRGNKTHVRTKINFVFFHVKTNKLISNVTNTVSLFCFDKNLFQFSKLVSHQSVRFAIW